MTHLPFLASPEEFAEWAAQFDLDDHDQALHVIRAANNLVQANILFNNLIYTRNVAKTTQQDVTTYRLLKTMEEPPDEPPFSELGVHDN